jgi:hypothetical protein
MTYETYNEFVQAVEQMEKATEALKRLKGMQGPEQGIVGESRSDRQRGTAEEAEPGERGVGEIALAVELRRHIERKREEARATTLDGTAKDYEYQLGLKIGKGSALRELSRYLDRISTERSDLANAKAMAAADTQTPNENGHS